MNTHSQRAAGLEIGHDQIRTELPPFRVQPVDERAELPGPEVDPRGDRPQVVEPTGRVLEDDSGNLRHPHCSTAAKRRDKNSKPSAAAKMRMS